MHTVIIGINGTCKTTLLRSIAIGLCGAADANALLAELAGTLMTLGEPDAQIIIDIIVPHDNNSPRSIVTEFEALENQDVVKSQEPSIPDTPFVVGYGIGVANEGESTVRPYRIVDSVFTLFNYSGELISAELTLRRLKDYLETNYYDKTLDGIKTALGLTKDVDFDLPRGGGVVVSGPSIGNRIPLASLADGYRITLSMILDLYAWAMHANTVTPSGGIKGVLLIDELERHIHPSLQTNVLLRLKKLWPELQIIGTTHSPLVTLGAHPEEVVVLRREGDIVYADEKVPNFTGYSAEDMLRDEDLFNTEVYAPETNRILDEYKDLAGRDIEKMKNTEKKRLKKLALTLRAQQILLAEESPTHKELNKLREDLGLEDSE